MYLLVLLCVSIVFGASNLSALLSILLAALSAFLTTWISVSRASHMSLPHGIGADPHTLLAVVALKVFIICVFVAAIGYAIGLVVGFASDVFLT
jgi:hypothetical protein